MKLRTLAICFATAICAAFSPALADERPDLYLSDNVVNVAPASITTNGSGWQFEFDEAAQLYHLTVPAGTNRGYVNSGDFQISTVPGNYTSWKTGLLFPHGVSANNSTVNPGVVYNLDWMKDTSVSIKPTGGHWMTIGAYNYNASYTFYVTADLSQLWVVPDLFMSDYLAGCGNFSTKRSMKFTYVPGATPAESYYRLIVPKGSSYDGSSSDYQISTTDFSAPGYKLYSSSEVNLGSLQTDTDLKAWRLGLYYVSGGGSAVSTSTGTAYDLTPRVNTTASHYMTISGFNVNHAYMFVVDGDLSTLAFEDLGDSYPALYIGGETGGSTVNPTSLDGLGKTAGNAMAMEYDSSTGLFSYTATSTLKGRFSLWDTRRMANRYTCLNRTSSDPLDFNTPYQLVQDNTLGDQEFIQDLATCAKNNIKVYVDLVNMKMWGVADDFAPYFISGATAAQTHANPGNFAQQPDGSWKYFFPAFESAEREIEISTMRSAEVDGDDYGFSTYQLTASALTLNGASQPLYHGTSTITIPEGFGRIITISADGTEISVTGSTERPTLYLSDNVTNVNPVSSTENGVNFPFTYDADKDLYHVYVPGGTVTNSTLRTGDFQISTNAGDYDSWRRGVIYATSRYYANGHTGSTIAANDTHYALTVAPSDNTESYWMKIGSYDYTRGYSFYVKGDLSEMWVWQDPAPMYIIGHLTNNLKGSYIYNIPETTSIRQMEYDPEKREYTYTMAGARWSVFEISSQAPPCSYANWVNNMIIYDSRTAGGEIVIQPVLMTNPFNADPDDLIKYKTKSLSGYTASQADAIKRDHSIDGYNPDWLYTVHLSDDCKEMWIMEQPINMPVKALDFIDQTDPNDVKEVPHYFVVGTRTADWRLLPEWELKPNVDGKVSLQGRFMYDGYFGIAKVDNYLDYIHHRYRVFANSLESDQDFKISDANRALIEGNGDINVALRQIPLKDCGDTRAMLYDTDDPVHDIHNSITWDIGINATASSGGIPNSDMMRYALPFRFSTLEVSLDADGNPTAINATGSYNRKTINHYRTFSLIGTDINYETPYDFKNALGVRDLRTMTSAFADPGTVEKNWANTWISYDENEVPYYDAYQRTLFLTAYDKNWLANHRTVFDIDLGHKDIIDGVAVPQMFVYKSDHLIFSEADPDDTTDEYAWVYGMHPSRTVDGETVGSDVIGWDESTGGYTVVDDKLDPSTNYRYQERLANYDISDVTTDALEHFHDIPLGDNGAPENPALGKDGWKCYVLKDVYLKGDFIVGSGWGGNLASKEGYDITPDDIENGNIPRNNFRLYFGNFSPRRGEGGTFSYDNAVWGYTVHGYDLKTSFEDGNPDSNSKLLYRTYRDIDETNFRTEGTAYENIVKDEGQDVAADYENVGPPQYYNRIILWYNTNADRTNAEVPNGVIQFVQESMAPNAKIYRQAGKPNQFYVEWEIADHTSDHHFDNWPVVSYQVTRYRYIRTTDGNGDETTSSQVYRMFDPEELTNTIVTDVKTGTGSAVIFNDPYSLPAGEYFYTVTVTIQNPADPRDLRSKTATTNTLAVALQSKTATIDARQQIETDGNGDEYYSFNVEAVTALTTDNTILNTESSHETALYRDAGYISIKVDDYTRAAFEKATDVEIANFSDTQLWNINGTGWWQIEHPGEAIPVPNASRPFAADQKSFTYLGWGLADECKDANGKPKFNANNEIRFILQDRYINANDNDDWRYINNVNQFRTQFAFPIIVWHNVKPTLNIEGGDLQQYKLECYMGPKDGVNKLFIKDSEGNDVLVERTLEDYWRMNLNLHPDEATTGVYAPSMTMGLSDIQLVKSAMPIAFDYNSLHATAPIVGTNMPVGSMSDASTLNDPVVYTEANEVTSTVRATIPLTQEVLDNHDITGNMTVSGATASFAVTKAGLLFSQAHNLPFFNESDDAREEAPTHYSSFMRAPTSRETKRYQPQSYVNYQRTDANTNTTVYDITSAKRRGYDAFFDGFSMESPIITKMAQSQHTYWCDSSHGPVSRPSSDDVIDKGAWYTRLLIQLGITNYDTDLAAYVGFHSHPKADTDYSTGSNGPRCLEGGHVLDHARYQYFNVPTQDDYVDWDGVSAYKSVNNWSWLAARDGKISLNAGVIGALPFTATPPTKTQLSHYYYPNIDLYVVYPVIPSNYFAIDPMLDPDDFESSRLLARRAPTSVDHTQLLPVTANATFATSFDASDPTITGVENVLTENNLTAGYYTIQGIKVENPQHGQVYIVVHTDGSITKEMY